MSLNRRGKNASPRELAREASLLSIRGYLGQIAYGMFDKCRVALGG